jgi:TRAP-type C4-dicarboxylate transport system substrate-binding protein
MIRTVLLLSLAAAALASCAAPQSAQPFRPGFGVVQAMSHPWHSASSGASAPASGYQLEVEMADGSTQRLDVLAMEDLIRVGDRIEVTDHGRIRLSPNN